MNKNFPAGSGMRFLKLMSACLLVLLCAALTTARTYKDAPVLLSEEASTRALASNPSVGRNNRLPRVSQVLWPANDASRVTIYVTNLLTLMPGERANAFRADAETLAGRRYDLPIESLVSMPGLDWIYAVTIHLNPDLGDAGDVLIRINWRGMSSNRVRLSIGHEGGGMPDDADAVPTPAPLTRPKPIEAWEENEVREEQQRLGRPFAPDNMRFLEQATFGPTFESELRLRRMGIQQWLDDQMRQKYDTNGAERFSTFPYPSVPLSQTDPMQVPGGCPASCLLNTYSMYKLQNWMFQEAMYSEDQQLRRRVSWALSQILVVSGRETVQSGRMLPYIQILDRNAFGNFRVLLGQITLNPAMGNYLDMRISTSTNPNENYAREILQLFSIGLNMLNKDGTPILDQNGQRIPSYDQTIVNEFTRVFTGWDLQAPQQLGIPNYISPMRQIPANHDAGEKHLLSYPGAISTIPAGLSDEQELALALDNICAHPNVPPFISKLLIQQLVTSNPTPAYVERVATVFEDDGHGQRGNLGAVVRAILLDPEARGDIKTDPDYGHLKEPFLFVTNIIRPFDPKSFNRAGLSDGVINGFTQAMDQDVFNPPSVFNYYPPDNLAPNTNILGPEYAIMTTGTTLKRPNFVNQMYFPNGATAPGIPVNVANNITTGTSVALDRLLPYVTADPTGGQLADQLNRVMMHGSMSQAMRNRIMTAVQQVSGTDNVKRARTAAYLVATSSQYQVQR